MALIVQKYGGTSVGSTERIKNVARRIARFHGEGHQLVVVVSAMSGETNRLLALASELSPSPDPRELDVIAATGMSSSAVYRYFRSKDELIAAAADEALVLVRDLFGKLLEQRPAPSPAEVITAMVDANGISPSEEELLEAVTPTAEREQLTYRGFLAELLLVECDDRDRRRTVRRVHAGGGVPPRKVAR